MRHAIYSIRKQRVINAYKFIGSYMKILNYKYLLLLFTVGTIVSAANNVQRPTPDQLLTQIPAVQEAQTALKDADAQIYALFLKDMQENRQNFINVLYGVYASKSEAENLWAIDVNGKTVPQNWIVQGNAAYMNGVKKETHTNAQKAQALADVQAAQKTVTNSQIKIANRLILAAYLENFELPAWQYYDPIWNKNVYAPEIDKLGKLVQQANNQKPEEPKKDNTNTALDSLKNTIRSVSSQLSPTGWALTNDGKDDVPYMWQDKINKLTNSLSDTTLYTTDSARKQIQQDMVVLKKTLADTNIDFQRRRDLIKYWTQAILPIWQHYDANFAQSTIKPTLDSMTVPPSGNTGYGLK
jgi:hypothetical protein